MIKFGLIQSAMLNGKHKELAPQRLDNLRELIRGSGVIRVEEICRQLRVSPATVRRDLDQLAEVGAIRRVHGGAVHSASGKAVLHHRDVSSRIEARGRPGVGRRTAAGCHPDDTHRKRGDA